MARISSWVWVWDLGSIRMVRGLGKDYLYRGSRWGRVEIGCRILYFLVFVTILSLLFACARALGA